VPFTVNGIIGTLPYYFVNVIYPLFAFLVSPYPAPMTDEAKTFNRLQEAIRQNDERLCGVLTKRFHILLQPGRYRCMKQSFQNLQGGLYFAQHVCGESSRRILEPPQTCTRV